MLHYFVCTSDLTLKKNVGIQNKNNCIWKICLLNYNSITYLFTEKYLQSFLRVYKRERKLSHTCCTCYAPNCNVEKPLIHSVDSCQLLLPKTKQEIIHVVCCSTVKSAKWIQVLVWNKVIHELSFRASQLSCAHCFAQMCY